MSGMSSYKKWSKEERLKSLKLTKKLRAYNILRPDKCCNRCGQDKGIIHWHNENYDITLEVLGNAFITEKRKYLTDEEIVKVKTALETLCWRCHMMHHSQRRAPLMVEKYFNEIRQGKQYPPVYQHNFKALREDHNVQ